MPPSLPQTPPFATRPARLVLDAYFLETRCKLIEIAATLDRVDRAAETAALKDDPRLAFIAVALKILQSPAPNRAEQIQNLYSLPDLPR